MPAFAKLSEWLVGNLLQMPGNAAWWKGIPIVCGKETVEYGTSGYVLDKIFSFARCGCPVCRISKLKRKFGDVAV